MCQKKLAPGSTHGSWRTGSGRGGTARGRVQRWRLSCGLVVVAGGRLEAGSGNPFCAFQGVVCGIVIWPCGINWRVKLRETIVLRLQPWRFQTISSMLQRSIEMQGDRPHKLLLTISPTPASNCVAWCCMRGEEDVRRIAPGCANSLREGGREERRPKARLSGLQGGCSPSLPPFSFRLQSPPLLRGSALPEGLPRRLPLVLLTAHHTSSFIFSPLYNDILSVVYLFPSILGRSSSLSLFLFACFLWCNAREWLANRARDKYHDILALTVCVFSSCRI
jgi:hypothetical protein